MGLLIFLYLLLPAISRFLRAPPKIFKINFTLEKMNSKLHIGKTFRKFKKKKFEIKY